MKIILVEERLVTGIYLITKGICIEKNRFFD